MYKKIIRAATGVLLSLSLAVAGFGMTANAASATQSGSINGTVVRGTIKTDDMKATATTTFSRTANITAKATVYYWYGKFTYCASASASSGAGGATAVATKKSGGAEVTGGKGEHKVICSDGTWGPKYTSTGDTPSNAIPE